MDVKFRYLFPARAGIDRRWALKRIPASNRVIKPTGYEGLASQKLQRSRCQPKGSKLNLFYRTDLRVKGVEV